MTRRLVITADDLGRDEATDATISSLAADGAITASSLITVSPRAADSLEVIRGLPLVPGLHATLSSEEGLEHWRPLSGASGLGGKDGVLPADPARAVAAATPQDVLAELEAQWSWMHARGLRPRVLDSHAGTLYGVHGRPFLAETLQWCASHSLALRLPRDARSFLGGQLPPRLRDGHWAAVELADHLGVPLPAAIVTNRFSAAEHGSYEALREHMIAQLEQLPEGTSELFVHPRSGTEPQLRVRCWEARLLRDGIWRRALAREIDELVTGWHP